jgi:hypothetical protein
MDTPQPQPTRCPWTDCQSIPTCGPLCDTHTQLVLDALGTPPYRDMTPTALRALATCWRRQAVELARAYLAHSAGLSSDLQESLWLGCRAALTRLESVEKNLEGINQAPEEHPTDVTQIRHGLGEAKALLRDLLRSRTH